MSAVVYFSARDYIDATGDTDVPTEVRCQLKIVCVDALVGLSIGDGPINNEWHALCVINTDNGTDAPVLACQYCGDWLAEAMNGDIDYHY